MGMTYTVCGFNQRLLVELGLDIVDAHILRWFVDFYNTGKMKKVIVKTKAGKPLEYVWLKYSAIANSLPILKVNDPHNIAKRLNKMCDCGIMVKEVLRRPLDAYTKKGTYTCFRIIPGPLQALLEKPDVPLPSHVLNVTPAELDNLLTPVIEPTSRTEETGQAGLFDNAQEITELESSVIEETTGLESSVIEEKQGITGLESSVIEKSPDSKVQWPPDMKAQMDNLMTNFTQAVRTVQDIIGKMSAEIGEMHKKMTTEPESSVITEEKQGITGLESSVVEEKQGITGLESSVITEEKQAITGLESSVIEEKQGITGLESSVVIEKQGITGLESSVISKSPVSKVQWSEKFNQRIPLSNLNRAAAAAITGLESSVVEEKQGITGLESSVVTEKQGITGLESSVTAKTTELKSSVIPELKAKFQELDSSLVFDDAFYTAAAAFMTENELADEYIGWVLDYARKREDIKNIRAYYYTVFRKSDVAEAYKHEQQAKGAERKETETALKIKCPACTTEFDKYRNGSCPACDLLIHNFDNKAEIERHKKIMSLPPEERKARLDEIQQAYQAERKRGGYTPDKEIVLAIDKKYGVAE
jgi:hypothetical protein